MRSTAVCSTIFRRDVLLHLINVYRMIPAATALQASTQLEAACRLFCVLRDEQLDVHRPVHFAPPDAAGVVCYTSAKSLAATS